MAKKTVGYIVTDSRGTLLGLHGNYHDEPKGGALFHGKPAGTLFATRYRATASILRTVKYRKRIRGEENENETHYRVHRLEAE